MDCNGWQRVACALEVIARNTSYEGPRWFEWLGVIIPALATLASVVTSVIALNIARRANSFSEESRLRDEIAARRTERERLGAKARARALGLYAASGGLVLPNAYELAVLSFELREEFRTSEEPHAQAMYEEFLIITGWFPPKGHPDAGKIGSVVQEGALLTVRAWVKDPARWHDDRQVRFVATKQAANEFRAKYGVALLP